MKRSDTLLYPVACGSPCRMRGSEASEYMAGKSMGPAKQAQPQVRQHRPSVPLNKVWWYFVSSMRALKVSFRESRSWATAIGKKDGTRNRKWLFGPSRQRAKEDGKSSARV
jgi:hypothetical protein